MIRKSLYISIRVILLERKLGIRVRNIRSSRDLGLDADLWWVCFIDFRLNASVLSMIRSRRKESTP
jgi:hypothetical protein